MKNEPVLVDCPKGHSFLANKIDGGPVLQEFACPICGYRWTQLVEYPVISNCS